MSHRSHSTGTSQQAGFGLVAWLESTRIVLPLRAVDCRFQVSGELLSVEMDQVFQQNNTQALDCLYTFPLPAGAAVYRCEMHVNGRIIRARVEEENRARELAAEHKAAGHRTALVEMDREKLFTLTLGNLQPGDAIVVRFAYFQTLTRLSDWSSFHIPFCPGVRYIPGKPLLRSASGKGTAHDTDQVPDASRISPPRMNADSEDVATLFIEGSVDDPIGLIQELSSPSHPLVVRDGAKVLAVGLAEGCSIPDQNFVLRWTETVAEELGAAAWSRTLGKDTYAMVRIMPPQVSDEVPAGGNGSPETDVYFLLDHSGSMDGIKWHNTAEAFVEFLKGMRTEDRVWLTLFNNGFQDFAEKPLSPSHLLRDRRTIQLSSLAPGGGTEVIPALKHVVSKTAEFSKNRRSVLVLITDGQIGNEQEVLEMLRQTPDLTLHVLGIDTAPNDAFLQALSDQHGGSWHQMHPNDDLVGTVKRLGSRLRPAALESLAVSEGWEPARSLPTKVYHGQSTVLLLKNTANTHAAPLEISGVANGMPWKASLDNAATGSEAVEKLWQKSRLDEYINQDKSTQAIELAKVANLICRGAAFIAWDESQKVIVSQKEVFQPVLNSDDLRSFEIFSRVDHCSLRSPRAYLQMDALTEEAERYPADASFDLLPESGAVGGMSGAFNISSDSEFSEIYDDPRLMSLATLLMADPWSQKTTASREAWAEFVAHLLRWLMSLERGNREQPCKAVGEILGSQPVEPRLRDGVIRGLLNWFETSMTSKYRNRSEAILAITAMRNQLASAH